MVRADADAEATQGHAPGVARAVAAGVLIRDKQRAVGQLHRLAVTIAAVDKKTVVIRRRDPRSASVAAEDQPQSRVSGA